MTLELAMRSRPRLQNFDIIVLFWSLGLALPLTSAGCGQTACFTWSEDEGACPAQRSALEFFQNPMCPTSIVSVDSEGDHSNDLCCYAVTKKESPGGSFDEASCGLLPPGSSGGVGGFGGTAVTVGSGSTLPDEPPSSCRHCAQVLANPTSFSPLFCSGSQPLFDTVRACLCEGACTSSCSGNFCMNRASDSACLSCLADSATGCGAEFDKCANDS
jgi:hypothetical protein